MLADGADADFHLTGSVRAASGQIRVTARLVEATGGPQLWSGRFDGCADDIFALQDEITRQVAVAMQVKLTSGDYARLWDGQTRSLAAWERCVVANGRHERWSEADNRRALMMAVIHGFAGRTDDARRAVAEAVRQKADIDQEQVRRSNRYRDPVRLERVIAALNAAGLPA